MACCHRLRLTLGILAPDHDLLGGCQWRIRFNFKFAVRGIQPPGVLPVGSMSRFHLGLGSHLMLPLFPGPILIGPAGIPRPPHWQPTPDSDSAGGIGNRVPMSRKSRAEGASGVRWCWWVKSERSRPLDTAPGSSGRRHGAVALASAQPTAAGGKAARGAERVHRGRRPGAFVDSPQNPVNWSCSASAQSQRNYGTRQRTR
jgi:hypothetical protein